MQKLLLIFILLLVPIKASALIIISFPTLIPNTCYVAIYDDFYNPIASGLIDCGGSLINDGTYPVYTETRFIKDLAIKFPRVDFQKASVKRITEREFLVSDRYKSDLYMTKERLPIRSLSNIIDVSETPAAIIVQVGCHYGVATVVTFDSGGYHFYEYPSIPCSGNWAVGLAIADNSTPTHEYHRIETSLALPSENDSDSDTAVNNGKLLNTLLFASEISKGVDSGSKSQNTLSSFLNLIDYKQPLIHVEHKDLSPFMKEIYKMVKGETGNPNIPKANINTSRSNTKGIAGSGTGTDVDSAWETTTRANHNTARSNKSTVIDAGKNDFDASKIKEVKNNRDIVGRDYILYKDGKRYYYDASNEEIQKIVAEAKADPNQPKAAGCPPAGMDAANCTPKGGFCWCYLKNTTVRDR